MSKTIEVTGCHDCPHFYDKEYCADGSQGGFCGHPNTFTDFILFDDQDNSEFCPLKKEPITVKLKDDEKERT